MNALEIAGAVGSIIAGIVATGAVASHLRQHGVVSRVRLIIGNIWYRYVWLPDRSIIEGATIRGVRYRNVREPGDGYELSIPFLSVFNHATLSDFKRLVIHRQNTGKLDLVFVLSFKPYVPEVNIGVSESYEWRIAIRHVESGNDTMSDIVELPIYINGDELNIGDDPWFAHRLGKRQEHGDLVRDNHNSRMKLLALLQANCPKRISVYFREYVVTLDNTPMIFFERRSPPDRRVLEEYRGDLDLTHLSRHPMPKFDGTLERAWLQQKLLSTRNAIALRARKR